MTIDEAQQEAERRWGPNGQVVESSHQRKSHFTVGICVAGESGFFPAIAGQGDSWEAAFREADKLANPLYIVLTGGFDAIRAILKSYDAERGEFPEDAHAAAATAIDKIRAIVEDPDATA